MKIYNNIHFVYINLLFTGFFWTEDKQEDNYFRYCPECKYRYLVEGAVIYIDK